MKLDDQLMNKDLTFFSLTYDRLMKEWTKAKMYKSNLETPFDYNVERRVLILTMKSSHAKSYRTYR
jgi:carboxyl-terminal processing protease